MSPEQGATLAADLSLDPCIKRRPLRPIPSGRQIFWSFLVIALSSALTQRAGILLLRWTVAGLMLFHGVSKLISGVDPIPSMLSSMGLPSWLAFGVLIGEVVAPLLILAGVLVQPAALVIAINMVVAVGLAHSSQLFVLGESGGYALELQAFYFLGALAIALIGDGRARS